jgi:hypothetical protein
LIHGSPDYWAHDHCSEAVVIVVILCIPFLSFLVLESVEGDDVDPRIVAMPFDVLYVY